MILYIITVGNKSREVDMKNRVIFLFLTLLIIPAWLSAGMIKGTQLETAQKYADKDESPVIFFDPGSGDAKGYILYADLNDDGENELIIPYRIHKTDEAIEDNADIYRQTLSVDVVSNGKKFRGMLEVDLAYAYSPIVYLTSLKISGNELPKVFLMVNDGVKKKDKKLTLMYSSYDKKDRKREQKIFETDKMPWELILYQFDPATPTITEFDIKYDQSYGKYYIRPLDGPDKSVRVSADSMKKFEEQVKKTRNDIFFEYDE